LYATFGSWRPAFLVTGALGLVWVIVWRYVYRTPSVEEGQEKEESRSRIRVQEILRQPQAWGIVLGRALTDPVWFFVTDWFAIFLVSRGFKLENTLMSFWVPFLAADFGNFAGGGISSWLIQRGWPVVRARKAVILVAGIGMAGLVPAIYAPSLFAIAGWFALSTFCYAAWSTMALTLPADLFPPRAVASVSGFSGTAAGLVTIFSTYLIGRVTDQSSFQPVLLTASIVPLIATALVFLLIRTPRPK
jgi:ACS family hexuronate transporter-like MFS transporter